MSNSAASPMAHADVGLNIIQYVLQAIDILLYPASCIDPSGCPVALVHDAITPQPFKLLTQSLAQPFSNEAECAGHDPLPIC